MTQISYYKKHLVDTKTFFFKKYEVWYYESIYHDFQRCNHYVLLGPNGYIEDVYGIQWFRKFPDHKSIFFAQVYRLWYRGIVMQIINYRNKIRNWYIEKYVEPIIFGMMHKVQEDMERNP